MSPPPSAALGGGGGGGGGGAQGFIDGAPPVPERFARGGIRVLGSWPLRSLANQIAYYDKETCATDDAIRVGLLHTARPAWEDDSVAWLLGGGYSARAALGPTAPTVTRHVRAVFSDHPPLRRPHPLLTRRAAVSTVR